MLEDSGLDERQTRVVEALDTRSPKLASMYKAALAVLGAPAGPGGETARISVICHCMRELMNALPAVMTDSAIARPDPSSSALTTKLPELLARHPDLDLAAEQDLLPVPRAVAQAFSDLIGTVASEQGRNRRNAAELVTGGADTKHPAIKHWTAAQRFFLGWTHIDRNHSQDRELPTDAVLLANIRVVEDVIEVRNALFFDNLHSLQDLLAEANAVEVGGGSA
ncbi:MAG: hypothetical protein ACT452_10615 [Microthrixaceae bacterium]